MPAGRNRDLGYTLEILGLRSDYDIHVFGATHYPPGIHGEAAHHDELRLCLRQAPQQLVEGWLAQLRRAAPVNRISL